VLRCVAVCCSVLRCVAVCCGVLQCVAVCCCPKCGSLMPLLRRLNLCRYVRAAVCCVVLQWRCDAVYCSVFLSKVRIFEAVDASLKRLQVSVCCSVVRRVSACCGVLRCVAVCCSVLQCVVVCCSVLQYVAVRGSRLQCIE